MSEGNKITQADFDAAAKKVFNLQRELDITNADHIALWLEHSAPLEGNISWFACRIIEAHEIEMAKACMAIEKAANERDQELFEALVTARDYVADAAAGSLIYADSGGGFMAMAKEDLARIDATLAKAKGETR